MQKTIPIVKQLYTEGTCTLQDLSARVNKSLSLVTKSVLDLVKEDWVCEAGIAESSGGRKPILYQLQPDAGYMVVMAMDQFASRVAIMNLRNELVTAISTETIDLAKDKEVIQKMERQLLKALENSNIPKEKILGIGIAMPGFIDFEKGINYTFSAVGKKRVSIRDYLQSTLGIPVYLDNDSSVIALAESIFGCVRGISNAMVINVSWGVGLGIIIGGKLYRGENGFAGEFSHIPIFNNGKICSCGKVGCLETETSLKVILQKANDAIGKGRASLLAQKLNPNESIDNQFLQFIQAVNNGDMLAIELLNESAYNIGRGIAILIHLFNPKKIVLSGRGALAGKVWLPPIQQAINEHCIQRLSENIEIEVSNIGSNAEGLGAAALVVDNYCNAPQSSVT